MATPIAGIPYPALGNSPNVPSDMQALATAVDGQVVPRFSTPGTRDSAITAPTAGQVCYVVSTDEVMIYRGGVWVSLAPRRIILASLFTATANSNTLQNVTNFNFSVEATSTYHFKTYWMYDATGGSSGADAKFGWTLPALATGTWSPGASADTSQTTEVGSWSSNTRTIASSQLYPTFSNTELFCMPLGVFSTAAASGTAQVQMASSTAVAAVSTRLFAGSYIEVWKVA